MPLEEVKKYLKMQITYLQNEGNQLIDAILLAVGGWSAQKKGMLPTLLAVVVADQAFEDNPEID